MGAILDAARKESILQPVSGTEEHLLRCLDEKREAFSGASGLHELSGLPCKVEERFLVRSGLIDWLCSKTEEFSQLLPQAIHVRGYRILGRPDLRSLDISTHLCMTRCVFPEGIDLRGASIKSLDMSGSLTAGMDADGMTVLGTMKLSDGFRSCRPVCLKGATIKGDLDCAKAQFNIFRFPQENTPSPPPNCEDCRSRTLHAYSLNLEKVKIAGSLNLCGGFSATGGVLLCDSEIGGNLNCTNGKFSARTSRAGLVKRHGRRLACDGDDEFNLACALNGDGMHIKGNLTLNGNEVSGEMRLTGAVIDGDLDSAGGRYLNKGSTAIHGDRLRVRGNIFFCDDFKAEGTVRLPRAEIGADFSFCNSCLSAPQKSMPLLFCEGIRVNGSMYLINTRLEEGFIDISYGIIGGNFDCTDGCFQGADGWAIKAKGMDIHGSAFLCSSAGGCFQALGVVSFTGAKLGMDLVCADGLFTSDKPCALEEMTPCAIMANNMNINGKVEMKGKKFVAAGGVSLDDTNIGSFLDCDQATFIVPPLLGNDGFAISAGKLHVDGSIYCRNGFNVKGEFMLNDASIGRNLNLENGVVRNGGGFSLRAMQVKVSGSVNMKNFKSRGEIRIDYATVGGNLDCSKGEFINKQEMNQADEAVCGDMKNRYAFHANGVKITGWAEFKDGFHADGIVSMQNAEIGTHFSWLQIQDPAGTSLYLDSARVGVLEDEEKSWPDKNMLRIDGFEYRFLRDFSPEGIKSRWERWLCLPPVFRTQPFEHLAGVLRRSGYEEEAKKVLIQKNRVQARLPVRRYLAGRPESRFSQGDGSRQDQSVIVWIFRKLSGALVCYGYKPGRAIWWGLALVLVGWGLFYQGFGREVMVPAKDKSHVFQTARFQKDTNNQELGKIVEGRGVYALVYSIDTFLPVIDFQTADYWLPSAHPQNSAVKTWGIWLCFYRWILIISGWVISSFFIAALTGLVRR